MPESVQSKEISISQRVHEKITRLWIQGDGISATAIYISRNLFHEWRTQDRWISPDMRSNLYEGIPYYIISNVDDYLHVI